MYGFGEGYPFLQPLDKSVVLIRDSIVSPYHDLVESGYLFEDLDRLRGLFFFIFNLNVLVDCGVCGAILDRLREISIG